MYSDGAILFLLWRPILRPKFPWTAPSSSWAIVACMLLLGVPEDWLRTLFATSPADPARVVGLDDVRNWVTPSTPGLGSVCLRRMVPGEELSEGGSESLQGHGHKSASAWEGKSALAQKM